MAKQMHRRIAHIREMSEYRPAFVARKGNPGFGWVVDVLWPDGETEVVKGFATEQQAAEWIANELGLKARNDNPSGAYGPLPVKVEPQRHSLFGSEVGAEFYRRPLGCP